MTNIDNSETPLLRFVFSRSSENLWYFVKQRFDESQGIYRIMGRIIYSKDTCSKISLANFADTILKNVKYKNLQQSTIWFIPKVTTNSTINKPKTYSVLRLPSSFGMYYRDYDKMINIIGGLESTL